jgi:hypothetical protein
MPVALQIDSRQMAKLQRSLGDIKDGVPKALAPAINRALSSGQTVVKREIRKEYLIKAKDIPTKVHRATRSTLSGEIRIDQGMLDISKFVYRPKAVRRGKKQRPLFVQVKKSGGGIVKRGFVTSSGPFQRRSRASRLPIRRILVIGAPIMASQPSVGPAVNKTMGDTLAKRIDHEITRVLASAGGHS